MLAKRVFQSHGRRINRFVESHDDSIVVRLNGSRQWQRFPGHADSMQTSIFRSVALPALSAGQIHSAIMRIEGHSTNAAEIIARQWYNGSLRLPVHDVTQHKVRFTSAIRSTHGGAAECSQTIVDGQKTDFTRRIVDASRKEDQWQVVAILAMIGFRTFEPVITVIPHFKDRGSRCPCAFLNRGQHHFSVM